MESVYAHHQNGWLDRLFLIQFSWKLQIVALIVTALDKIWAKHHHHKRISERGQWNNSVKNK